MAKCKLMIEIFVRHRVASESDIAQTSISVAEEYENSDRLILTGFCANEGEVRISRADIHEVINVFQKWQRGNAGREAVVRQLLSDLDNELPDGFQFSPEVVLRFFKDLPEVRYHAGVDQLTEILAFARDLKKRNNSLRQAIDALAQKNPKGSS